MRILIRTSKWAIWARRAASIAVPLVVIPVFLHRQRLITSDIFETVAAVAGAVALLALLVSLIALARLWQSGDQGWGRALSALLLSVLCLLPLGYVGMQIMRYPVATDIFTTGRDLLPLTFEPSMLAMPPPRLLSPAVLEARFPNVKTRTYPLNVQQTFKLVLHIVEGHGWDIRQQRDPVGSPDVGMLDAQIVTLFGWRDEVVLRVAGDEDAATVDMRSASLNARHDLGSNGLRISQLLVDLDDQVTALLRDNPNANQPVEPDAPEPDAEPSP